MWAKKNKDKEERTVVKTTQTRQVTQSSQTLSVRTTEQRIRSISTGSSENTPIRGSLPTINSLSRLDNKNALSIPQNSVYKTASASSLGGTRVNIDARPVVLTPSPINLNYQSPYRNSPVYSSFQQKPVSATATATGTAYRRPLPATVQPLPPSASSTKKKIVVKKTGKFHDSSSPVPTYQTRSKKRGEVLIINNIMFKDKGERFGAKVDHDNLETLFKQMGFKVSIEKDLSSVGMVSKMKSFSKRSSLSNVDVTVAVVMSHGTKNQVLGGTEVFGLDEKGVLVEDLIKCFNETECKHMANKPKIFIFQCCRGDNELFFQTDATGVPPKVPALTNALIAYSTLPGFVSHRDPVHGTWYISTLCEVFSQHAHEYHVEDLLKMVDVNVSSIARDVKQTTHYENRGFKRCYLHPQ